MNDTLTLEQIRAAQRNELDGIKAVLDAMTDRIARLAKTAANRMTQNGLRYADYVEDYTQDASLELFEALPRFDGSTVDSFFAFMHTTIDSKLKDKVRAERNPGAHSQAVKVFASMLERADGDLHLAEKLAQSVPPKGVRLGADNARAARMAWQGAVSLESSDVRIGAANGKFSEITEGLSYSIAENLPSTFGVPEDLIMPEDLNSAERQAKIATVNAVLESMGEGQRVVLAHSFGIGGVTCYGYGDSGDDDGLAAEIGSTVLKVRDARSKGFKAFAKRYIKAVANSDEEAAELTASAAERLSPGGRK